MSLIDPLIELVLPEALPLLVPVVPLALAPDELDASLSLALALSLSPPPPLHPALTTKRAANAVPPRLPRPPRKIIMGPRISAGVMSTRPRFRADQRDPSADADTHRGIYGAG
ncbi:MAG: hypothetical protein KC420_11655 [Myxococcales bacterium]|nr:hypothetical protein [Myxococcales bacterium]